MRVFPGGLAISRAFGNPYAKLAELGGKPNVITAVPEIRDFKLQDDNDFIVLACIEDN
jgi:protein phosphatase 2C family protein 2/3